MMLGKISDRIGDVRKHRFILDEVKIEENSYKMVYVYKRTSRCMLWPKIL